MEPKEGERKRASKQAPSRRPVGNPSASPATLSSQGGDASEMPHRKGGSTSGTGDEALIHPGSPASSALSTHPTAPPLATFPAPPFCPSLPTSAGDPCLLYVPSRVPARMGPAHRAAPVHRVPEHLSGAGTQERMRPCRTGELLIQGGHGSHGQGGHCPAQPRPAPARPAEARDVSEP